MLTNLAPKAWKHLSSSQKPKGQRFSEVYQAYLKSPEWRERRERAIAYASGRCEKCGSKANLQVHHLTYDNLGDEQSLDLMVLCATCHASADLDRKRIQKKKTAHLEIWARTVYGDEWRTIDRDSGGDIFRQFEEFREEYRILDDDEFDEVMASFLERWFREKQSCQN